MRPVQYSHYLCDTCNRKKSFTFDSIHVQTLDCIITQGCTGKLRLLGIFAVPIITELISGVKNWIPRGQYLTTPIQQYDNQIQDIYLGTSISGALTLAINDENISNNQSIKLVLSVSKPNSIGSKQYFYTPNVPFSVIMGADNSGKILRITPEAAAEGRVKVRKNGIILSYLTDYTVTLNSISLNSTVTSAASIDVEVLDSTLKFEKVVFFTRNEISTIKSAWSNIRYIKINDKKYWLFSSSGIIGLGNGSRAQISHVDGIDNWEDKSIFLLSTDPNSHVDRCMIKVVNCGMLKDDYDMQLLISPYHGMYVRNNTAIDIFPPIYITPEWSSTNVEYSRISKDIIDSSSSNIDLNSDKIYLTNKHIIGPT